MTDYGKHVCMYVDAKTQQFHTENDCTYTLILVTNQAKSYTRYKYYFSFDLSDKMNIGFRMKSGTRFMSSGQFITHRQLRNTINKDMYHTFINFASHSYARLYRNICKSFHRVQESIK